MSAILNISPRHYPLGNYGPFASASVSVDQNGYGVTFTKSADWPASEVANGATLQLEQGGAA
jgi:hypothetical protein